MKNIAITSIYLTGEFLCGQLKKSKKVIIGADNHTSPFKKNFTVEG